MRSLSEPAVRRCRSYRRLMLRTVVPGATARLPAYRTVRVPAAAVRSAPFIGSDADHRPRATPTRRDAFTVRPRTRAANVTVSRPVAVTGSVPLTRRRPRSRLATRTRGVPSARTAGAATRGGGTVSEPPGRAIAAGASLAGVGGTPSAVSASASASAPAFGPDAEGGCSVTAAAGTRTVVVSAHAERFPATSWARTRNRYDRPACAAPVSGSHVPPSTLISLSVDATPDAPSDTAVANVSVPPADSRPGEATATAGGFRSSLIVYSGESTSR